MMGRQTSDQSQLFYLFNLERRIPAGHLLRRINPVVTRILIELREKLTAFYSDIGRPSIDPELMIRMLIVGYCYGIRFERRLCEELELHLAYRWFCRLDLDDKVPDHSTFSVNRMVASVTAISCAMPVWSRVRGLPSMQAFWRPMPAAITARRWTRSPGPSPTARAAQSRSISLGLMSMRNPMPIASRRSSYRQAIPARPGRPRPTSECSSAMGLIISSTSRTRSLSTLSRRRRALMTRLKSTKTMLDRTEQRLGLKPKRLAADTAYGTGRFLGWLVGRRIAPHIPVRDASERDDGTLSRSDFRWDRRWGVYICPNGKVLHTTGKVHEGKTLRYLASKYDCDVCALKMQCCPKSPSRQIPRDVHEYARDVTRRLMRTKAFLKSRDQRKRVEMRFAHLKIYHGFERMRLRGLSGARDEFLLAATVQNLKTLALRILGPPPARRRAFCA